MKARTIFSVLYALSFAAAVTASAQPNEKYARRATAADTEEERYMVVTGSHIPQKVKVKRTIVNGKDNVRVYTEEDIARSGHATTGRALRSIDPSIRVSRP